VAHATNGHGGLISVARGWADRVTTWRWVGELSHQGRQDRVKANRPGVKEPSDAHFRLIRERTLSQGRSPRLESSELERRATAMADVAYLALTLGVFLLLALLLRGLEKI
jgi:hypothetical protein